MIQKAGLIHFHGLRAVSMPNKVISGPRKKFDVENWPICPTKTKIGLLYKQCLGSRSVFVIYEDIYLKEFG